jgi:hypothetical protein
MIQVVDNCQIDLPNRSSIHHPFSITSTMGISTDRFTDVPHELTLLIFSHLNLRGLMAVRGVSQAWRALVPHVESSPIRKKMLSFYDTLIASPLFLRTRPWVLENLKAFNRQAFVEKLLGTYPFLSEEFRLWILEWPEKAVIGGLWPGLPRKRYQNEYADGIHVREDENWIAFPRISGFLWEENKTEYILALVVWQEKTKVTCLILDERRDMNGKVFTFDETRLILHGPIGALHNYVTIEDGWIDYQRGVWHRMVEREHLWESRPPKSLEIHESPQIAWVKRNGIEGQNWLAMVD